MPLLENFSGYLMSKDTPLATIERGYIEEVINPELLPIFLARTKDLKDWLEKRAIDAHRTHSRLLKKVLRLTERDDASTALAVNAATITDTYWVKPKDSNLTWDDVRFTENYFSSLALRGDLSAFSQSPSRTPELTNTGSFEKCWELENGKWWLYKSAKELQLFSELFIYHLGKKLGFHMAHYEEADGYIRSLDFTDGASVNFEAAYSWMLDEEDYTKNYRALEQYGTALQDQYVEILILDCICLNGDRHTFNYGVLRDPDTGAVLSMAPNFDNNIALLANDYLKGPRKPDLLGFDLRELEKDTGAISSYATRHPLPVITHELIDECIDATGMEVDRDYLHHFIMVGYEQTPIPRLLKQT